MSSAGGGACHGRTTARVPVYARVCLSFASQQLGWISDILLKGEPCVRRPPKLTKQLSLGRIPLPQLLGLRHRSYSALISLGTPSPQAGELGSHECMHPHTPSWPLETYQMALLPRIPGAVVVCYVGLLPAGQRAASAAELGGGGAGVLYGTGDLARQVRKSRYA